MNKTGSFFTALNSKSATAFYEAVCGQADKLNYDRGNVRVKKQDNAVISLSRFKKEEELDMGIRMTDAALNKPFQGLYRKILTRHTEKSFVIFKLLLEFTIFIFPATVIPAKQNFSGIIRLT